MAMMPATGYSPDVQVANEIIVLLPPFEKADLRERG
jgi:hypothetical protein